MKPKFCGLEVAILLFFVQDCGAETFRAVQPKRDGFDSGERTFLFGKLVLVPVLAAIGLKFLALLPIVLSKIALLGIMNFLSTNLNLLVSTIFGMKNFLGKHGLWAQEDMTRHPELEAFADHANQPWYIQPASLRYTYSMDKEPLLGRIETSKSSFLNNYDGFGFDSGYKTMLDRKTRVNDKRQIPRAKEQRSVDEEGKYRCYWTNEESTIRKRKFNMAEQPRIQLLNHSEHQLGTNRGTPIYLTSTVPNVIADQPTQSYSSSPNVYDYRSPVKYSNKADQLYQQVATHKTAAQIDDGSSIRDQLPFTHGQVKVAENYRDEILRPSSTTDQPPLVYLMRETDETMKTAKFKDTAAVYER